MSRIGKIIVVLFAGLGLVGAFGLALVFIATDGDPAGALGDAITRFNLSRRSDELHRPLGTDATPTRFHVEPGEGAGAIAQKLFTANLIADAQLFVDYVRVEGFDTQLEAGVYFLNQTQTLAEIAVALTDSASSNIPFRILEGWRLEEVARAIDDNLYFDFSGADFLAVAGPGAPHDPEFAAQAGLPPGASLEGFLFPDTYQLPAETTPAMLRDILTEAFLGRVGEQAARDATAQGLSRYDVVTLASIVEREAVHVDEQPLIASVYRNRLAGGMKLDADPTVQYAMGFREGTWWPPLTVADYSNVVSSYNTYLNPGLPPGPIANPGIDAIRAVIYPAESPYLYFRATCEGDGYHNFAVTFEAHVANGCP